MKSFKFLITRLNITIYLLMLQIAFFLALAIFIFIRYPIFSSIGTLLSGVVFLALVKKDKPAAFKLTWIIVVLTFLQVGGILYLIFGDKRPTRKIAKYVDEHALIAKYLDLDEEPNEVKSENCGRMSSLFHYIRNSSSYHAYKQTDIEYYRFGEEMFADLLSDLSDAENYIFLEYFIIKDSLM